MKPAGILWKLAGVVCIACWLGGLDWPGLHGAMAQSAEPGDSDPPAESAPAAVSPSRSPRDAMGPRALLGGAIRSLDAARTLTTGTRVRGCLFDRSLVGSGAYWERKGTRGVEYRWEMKFQVGDDTASFVQVCNGRTLWIGRELGRRQLLDRIDVERVLEASGNNPQSLPPTAKCGSWLLLGGLGKTLASLDYAFEFDSAEEFLLDRDVPAIRLEGRWKPAVLEKILPEPKKIIQDGKIAKPERLPPQFPHTVSVCLEKGVLFPRRIEYIRQQVGGRLGESTSEYVVLAAIDFVDLVLDRPLSESVRFKLDSAAQESDRTDQFLANLGLKKRESRPRDDTTLPPNAVPSVE